MKVSNSRKGGETMYETKQIYIKKGHKMYPYFDELCHNCNNLYNATNFIIRQYATAKQAFETYKPLYEHQMDVFQQVESVIKNKELAGKIKEKDDKKKKEAETPYVPVYSSVRTSKSSKN